MRCQEENGLARGFSCPRLSCLSFILFRTSIRFMEMRFTENNEKLTKRSKKTMRMLCSFGVVSPVVVLVAERVGEGVDWKGENEKARKK